MLPDDFTSNIKVQEGKRSYRFGNLEVLPLLNQVSVFCILSVIRVDIVTDVVEVDISPLSFCEEKNKVEL